jgi:glycosyltransferase involved in cell wall biosynthesis
MKIGYDAKRAFCNKTGLGNYSRFVIENILKISSEKLEIIAFTPKIKKGFFETFPFDKIVMPKKSIFLGLWRIYFIKKDIENQKLDIFHGLSNEIPIFTNWGKIKTIVTIHDLIFLKYPTYYAFFDRHIYNLKFKYACKKADKIIAVSEKTKADIIHFYKIPENKIEVIYQSCNEVFKKEISLVDQKKNLEKYQISNPFLLSVGTLEPRKNQISIIKAFSKIARKDYDLVLIGKGEKYKMQLESLIRKENIQNVKILGNVTHEDLPAIYQASELFIYISLYEGFGIPILEALASEKPVIAARGSCLEEAGGDGAIYVDPLNILEITNTINKALDNQNLKYDLIKNGIKHFKKFDSELLNEKMLSLYEETKNA